MSSLAQSLDAVLGTLQKEVSGMEEKKNILAADVTSLEERRRVVVSELNASKEQLKEKNQELNDFKVKLAETEKEGLKKIREAQAVLDANDSAQEAREEALKTKEQDLVSREENLQKSLTGLYAREKAVEIKEQEQKNLDGVLEAERIAQAEARATVDRLEVEAQAKLNDYTGKAEKIAKLNESLVEREKAIDEAHKVLDSRTLEVDAHSGRNIIKERTLKLLIDKLVRAYAVFKESRVLVAKYEEEGDKGKAKKVLDAYVADVEKFIKEEGVKEENVRM